MKPDNKPKWHVIKGAYQKGQGSCRALAERFNVSFAALRNRHAREKWTVSKKQFETKVIQSAEEKTLVAVEASVEELVLEQKAHIQRTIALCNALYIDITRSRAQLLPAIDPVALDALSRSLVRINSVARESLGIPDKPTSIDLTSKNRSLGESFVSAIQKLRENPATPKLTSRDIDLVIEAGIIDD